MRAAVRLLDKGVPAVGPPVEVDHQALVRVPRRQCPHPTKQLVLAASTVEGPEGGGGEGGGVIAVVVLLVLVIVNTGTSLAAPGRTSREEVRLCP